MISYTIFLNYDEYAEFEREKIVVQVVNLSQSLFHVSLLSNCPLVILVVVMVGMDLNWSNGHVLRSEIGRIAS